MKDELSAYAPIRLRGLAYYQYARNAVSMGWITTDGMIQQGLHEDVERVLVNPATQFVIQSALAGDLPGSAAGQTMAKVLSYSDWVPLFGQYEACGKQIFDLHDSLTELLKHTDVHECTLEDLHLPYDCIYLHFGKLTEVRHIFDGEAGTYEYVDGVFVAQSPWDAHGGSRIKLGFSTVHDDGSGVMYPGLFFDILPEERKLPVFEGLNRAMQRRQETHAHSNEASDTENQIREHMRAADEEGAQYLRDAASYVVNALFYLESLNNDLPPVSPGRDTPPSLWTKWASAPPRNRLKQRSSLLANGYAVVRLVGEGVSSSASQSASNASRKVHWRRGHWRQQPYGENHSLRRRRWIKPILVGAGDGPTVTHGHIYVPPGSDLPQ